MSDHSDADEGGSSSSVVLDTKKPKHPKEQSLQEEDDKPEPKEFSINLNETTAEQMEQFCVELESPGCVVEILRLTGGRLSERSCSALTSALKTNPSFLRELHLTGVRFPDDQQLSLLLHTLGNQDCRIRTLRLVGCGLSRNSCVNLRDSIKRNPSNLKELDLSQNHLDDSGVMVLCDGLMDESCKLERLKLNSCRLSGYSCSVLNKLLMSTSCHLQELDLSRNSLQDDGIEQLSVGLSSPNCKLSILRLAQCQVTDKGCAVLIKALERRPLPLDELDLQDNYFNFKGVMMLDEFKIRSGIRKHLSVGPRRLTADSHRFSEGSSEYSSLMALGRKNPWATHFDTTAKRKAKFSAAQSSSFPSSDEEPDLEPDSSRGNTQLEEPEVDEAPSYFTSEVFHEQGRISYRFRGLGPGVFLCKLTGLGFTMTGGGELLYKIIEWDEDLLQASGKLPAGPLFKIEGATNAVSQLHLLHCEQNPTSLSNGLSVVHMSDDGMIFLKPLEINDTHVVVAVSHFSAFGLVIDFFKRILNIQRPVSSHVLLFHRPTWTVDCQKVNVFLLPKNIPVEEVKPHQENANYIEAPSSCKLIRNRTYFLQCPESTLVQPDTQMGSEFDSSFGKVYHPNFEIRLMRRTEEATVVVKGQDKTTVWKYYMKLTAQPPASEASTATLLTQDLGATAASSSTSWIVPSRASEHTMTLRTDDSGPDSGRQDLQAPMKKKLFSMRESFIHQVSKPSLFKLMDRLLHKNVIPYQEYQSIKVMQPVSNAATALIDTVLNKGEQASEVMIKALSKIDTYLYEDLDSQVLRDDRGLPNH